MPTRLVVDGESVDDLDLHRYTLRWYVGNDGPVPTLYEGGRRVTRAWKMTVEADIPADPTGGNANTA